MDAMIHFPLSTPRPCLQSKWLAWTGELSGCLLRLHFGCRMTGKGRFGLQKEYVAHGCGWHITEPGGLLLLLAPFLPPWDHFLTSVPVFWGVHGAAIDFAPFISLTTGAPAVWSAVLTLPGPVGGEWVLGTF